MKYALVGYTGRMGAEITSLFGASGHELVMTVDENGGASRGVPQIVLDFSRPSALESTLRICREHTAALVLGTTGLSSEDMSAVREMSRLVPVVYSANYGVGINILMMMLSDYSEILSDWEMEMEEMHHNKKIDAPSGTALALMDALGRKCPAHSVRLGNLPGDHTVYLANSDELLTFTHRTINRSALSRGALLAAEFAISAGKGYYNFQDVLRKRK
ncbi:MAG: 4-hydroxy-tetrahydrodipicolinate reductase [Synergistaceae bacterium]|jgi:4-hydroxy-tetrahydrodipicolinate reductase|nr:4-hydroxy-tetrahydrodipicolinate reductase [Synergistaceae bacterium]